MDEEKTATIHSGQTKYIQIHQPRRKMMINNFLGGISWALGATIGVAIILAILTLIGHYINVIPVVGSFISDIIDYILKTNSHFSR